MTRLSPYSGPEDVQLLQRRRDAQVEELRDMPGAVVHARTFSTDDPEALGWDRLREVMAEEGRVALRGATGAEVARAREVLAAFSPVEHVWDIFLAGADAVRAACRPILGGDAARGLTRLAAGDLTDARIREVQEFLAGHGVSPFSRDALTGALFPAEMVVLTHADGRIAAAAFAALTHNRHSRFHGVAWVGLVAVDPALRGRGLGKHVDALANLVAVDDMGATGTMEFVAPDNLPSRAMLEACGLRLLPDRRVVMFSTSGERMTR